MKQLKQCIPSVLNHISVKNNTIHKNFPILTGRCLNCTTLYSADHERSPEIDEENQFTKLYLNSAKYIKVGQSVWVDRIFSNAVVNAMYSFHASASAYMEFGIILLEHSKMCFTRCHVIRYGRPLFKSLSTLLVHLLI